MQAQCVVSSRLQVLNIVVGGVVGGGGDRWKDASLTRPGPETAPKASPEAREAALLRKLGNRVRTVRATPASDAPDLAR